METRLLSFDTIQYKRKVYDEGVILGKRPWKWTLGNKYSPCSARRLDNNLQVSTFSPHKQNFSVYISRHSIEIGDTYKIVNHEYGQDRVESVVRVEEIGANWCKVCVIEENIVKPIKKTVKELQPVYFEERPLDPDWQIPKNTKEPELTAEEQANLAELLKFFEDVTTNEEQHKEVETDRPCVSTRQGSTQGPQEVSEETSSTSRGTIMLTNNFVKGKNQNSFAFAMVNEGKEQLSMFALPETQKTTTPAPVEPRQTVTPPAKIQAKRPEPQRAKIEGFSNEEIAILDAIGKGAEHIDGIIQKSGLNAGLVAGMLLMLEMKDQVKQKPGRFFIRT